MSLRIACDLDGTVADMARALQREATQLFGPGVTVNAPEVVAAAEDENVEVAPPTSAPESNGEAPRPLTRRELKRLWAHVRSIENFWTTLEEIEAGAVAQLAMTASVNRWEVLFLTQRPPTAGDTAQVQTQQWLSAHGFDLPAVYVMNGSRGKVADALSLDAVIDDRPENCLDVKTDSRAESILIWRERTPAPPAAAPLGIVVVGSFAEALRHVQSLMNRNSNQGFLGRVRAAIGI
jgi:hypothetical protein